MTHEATIQGIAVGMSDEGMGAPVVLLEARNEIIPIFVGADQARTIQRAREGIPAERPMTHDLFAGVLDDAGVTIDRVRIDDLTHETFHAKLDLSVEDGDTHNRIVRDARPSDGLALAVRVDCPVMITDDVIDAAGHPPAAFTLDDVDCGSSGPIGGGPGSGAGSQQFSTSEPDPEQGEEIDIDDAVDIDLDVSESDSQDEGEDETDDDKSDS